MKRLVFLLLSCLILTSCASPSTNIIDYYKIKELDNVKENIKDEISFQIAKNSSTVMDILSNISNKKKTPKKPKSTDVDTESSAE